MFEYKLPEGITLQHLVGTNRTLADAFAAIINWDTTYIQNRLLKEGVIAAEVVDEAITEWRKFLMLVAVSRVTRSGSVGMMSKTVDEVWHAAILFTREYFDLSAQILGEGQYLHHAPNVGKSNGSTPSKNVFAELYHQMFGLIPDIWGVKYGQRELIWNDAMQGLCVVDVQMPCEEVCKSDAPCSCEEGGMLNDSLVLHTEGCGSGWLCTEAQCETTQK